VRITNPIYRALIISDIIDTNDLEIKFIKRILDDIFIGLKKSIQSDSNDIIFSKDDDKVILYKEYSGIARLWISEDDVFNRFATRRNQNSAEYIIKYAMKKYFKLDVTINKIYFLREESLKTMFNTYEISN
jgi:hypothetical protein